jgi:pimeloyl-ACP methyl ester carboxylesterase
MAVGFPCRTAAHGDIGSERPFLVIRIQCLALGIVLILPLPAAQARDWFGKGRRELEEINARLHGQIVDYTHNHGADRRMWSESLGEARDLYIYLPPGYDPAKRYPMIIALHGFAQDERSFLRGGVGPLDEAMAKGQIPCAIIAVPDGSVQGDGCKTRAGSFFINSKAGRFEDFIMQDVWNLVTTNYSIHPERNAHILLGVSMGGGAAFRLGIRYKDRVGLVAGFFPPVNTRYVDCHGRYLTKFDPDCQGLRTDLSRAHEVIGRFYLVVPITLSRLLDPIYDRKDPNSLAQLAQENPFEMLDTAGLRDGELPMFIGFGGRDEFNIDAQVESFLYKTKQMGLTVQFAYDRNGHHNYATYSKLLPYLFDWLSVRMALGLSDAK